MVSNGLMFGKDTHITLYLSTDFRQFKVKHYGILLCQPLFHAKFFSKKLEIIDWIKFIEAFANFEVCTRLKLKWAVVKILALDCLGGITLHIINHDCNAFFVTMHSLFQKRYGAEMQICAQFCLLKLYPSPLKRAQIHLLDNFCDWMPKITF